jgi:nitrogen fixation NifU-like protein
MIISDELYREVILDHFKSPRRHGKIEKPDVVEMGVNPLCGDELELSLSFKNGAIADIRFQGKGCSISQASASMMAEAMSEKSVADARKIAADFRGMMLEGKPVDALPDALEDAKSLEGVKNYPVRIKCALLPWNTLLEGLKKYGKAS